MKCAFHPDREVAGYCGQCGRALCAECFQASEPVGECSACLATRPQPAPLGTGEPGAEPAAPPPSAPRRPTGLWWLIGLGCACLVLALVLLAALGVLPGRQLLREQTIPEEAVRYPPLHFEHVTGPEQRAGPGQEAALAFARSRKPGWSGVVTDHSDDWRSAYVVIGPSEGDWRTWLDLRWDDGQQDYLLSDEGPIAAEEGEDEEVPEIYQPGEEVAKEAALAESPDWVAKVVEHSEDWKSATVWIGPPESEFVWALKLKWRDDLDCYEVVGSEDVPYPE